MMALEKLPGFARKPVQKQLVGTFRACKSKNFVTNGKENGFKISLENREYIQRFEKLVVLSS
jgi:hypothetical protein